jgi:hypothetical protein
VPLSQEAVHLRASAPSTKKTTLRDPHFRGWDDDLNTSPPPPSNQPPPGTQKTSKNERFNRFRQNIALLRHPDTTALMDNLDEGIKDNGRFGTNGIKRLADLGVNDPLWTKGRFPILPENRKRIKEAARQVFYQSGDLLKGICGDDWIFEKNDMKGWLRENPIKTSPVAKDEDPYTKKLREFGDAMMILRYEPGARKMMDNLEKKGTPGNNRFGTGGKKRVTMILLCGN